MARSMSSLLSHDFSFLTGKQENAYVYVFPAHDPMLLPLALWSVPSTNLTPWIHDVDCFPVSTARCVFYGFLL
jgi:hypothetical protein